MYLSKLWSKHLQVVVKQLNVQHVVQTKNFSLYIVNFEESADQVCDLFSCVHRQREPFFFYFFSHLNLLNFEFMVFMKYFATWESRVSNMNRGLPNTDSADKSCIEVDWSPADNHSVTCRGGVTPIIIALRSDVFQCFESCHLWPHKLPLIYVCYFRC